MLLQATAEDPLPGQVIPPPFPFIVQGKEGWEIDEILDSKRTRGGRLQCRSGIRVQTLGKEH